MEDAKKPVASSHTSGARCMAPYAELRTLLLAYLSPILVDTVLNQALYKRRISPHTLTRQELHELAPDMMLGLRLFVAEKRLPELMLALAELIEENAG